MEVSNLDLPGRINLPPKPVTVSLRLAMADPQVPTIEALATLESGLARV